GLSGSTHLPVLFCSTSSRHPPALHSFPTRRSSDLLARCLGRAAYVVVARLLRLDPRLLDVGPEENDAVHFAVEVRLPPVGRGERSEEHTSELQSRFDLVCRLLLEKKKKNELIGGLV